MNRSPSPSQIYGISQWYPDICHKISWKTSQASRLYSLVTEVDQPGTCNDIWNHYSVNSILHILWAAKCIHHKKGQIVCCWKGMENLLYGSQNHHVCHIAWLKAYLHYLWWMWDQDSLPGDLICKLSQQSAGMDISQTSLWDNPKTSCY